MPTTNGAKRVVTTTTILAAALIPAMPASAAQPAACMPFAETVAATWTGPTFTFGYSIQQPAGRLDGSRMTFGAPITRLETLTYRLNGGQGIIPNQQEGTNQ